MVFANEGEWEYTLKLCKESKQDHEIMSNKLKNKLFDFIEVYEQVLLHLQKNKNVQMKFELYSSNNPAIV